MTPATATVNKGWTIYGKTYHVAVYRISTRRHHPPIRCGAPAFLDQTVLDHGSPTGALVPTDLRPCKRCFPDGDE